MDIEKRLRPDLWKAIQAHYERSDYTEAVRDALFHVCEVLREKSGLENVDGTKLVNDTLLGSNPMILVNRNETTTEKDIQQGIGFSFKGLMQAIRNPMSHENTAFSQYDSEAIILYINYLLDRVDQSGGYTKIDNITNLLFDKDFTATEEYAELLLKEVPSKKKYDLLVELYQRRGELPTNTLSFFIQKLFDSLPKTSKGEFLRMVSTSLLICKNDKELRMYLHYFMLPTYSDIDRLAQLRIEAFILKAIHDGRMEAAFAPDTFETTQKCNSAGSLATWVQDPRKYGLLTNKAELQNALFTKIESKDIGEEQYVFQYFQGLLLSNPAEFTTWKINVINAHLNNGDRLMYGALEFFIGLMEDEDYCKPFGEAYAKCAEIISQENDAPY